MKTTSGTDVVEVPLNPEKFRRYRDMQASTAFMGAAMSLGTCGFTALGIYGAVVDAHQRNTWIGLAVFSLVLPLLIGLSTLPAMLTATALTNTLKNSLPALLLTQEGIEDNASNYVFGFIPWNQIEYVEIATRHATELNKDFIGLAVVVKSKDVLLQRKLGLMTPWLNMDAEISNRRQVFIPQGRIAIPVEEAVEKINRYWARMNV